MNHKLESRLPGEISITSDTLGFPGGSDGKEERIHLWCGRPGFHPWVGKVPWRREWQPTPVLLFGEFHGWGAWRVTVHGGPKELGKTEWLTLSLSQQRRNEGIIVKSPDHCRIKLLYSKYQLLRPQRSILFSWPPQCLIWLRFRTTQQTTMGKTCLNIILISVKNLFC